MTPQKKRSASPEVAKVKEGDRIRLAQFPNVNTLESWKADMVLQVIATSGRYSGQAIPWLKKADDDKVTMDELAEVPKRLRTLDQKLAATLVIIQKGEFQCTISHLQRQLMSEKVRVLTGTQILRKMYMSLRTTRSMRTSHSIPFRT